MIFSSRRWTILRVMELYVMTEESAWLGSACVRKLVHVGWEETRNLERGLSDLGCASLDALVRRLLRGPARRPSRGGGAQRGPSDDQVSVPTEMV
ncbi:hypothetical protein BHE74_00051718 [Ensete ventricosum]|nr:hypothetical protein BHE74_00051718 [Ensete ventricosum]